MMNSDDSYVPVSCEIHCRYERHILERHGLRVAWQDKGGHTRLMTGQPMDLVTCQGEEFLEILGSTGERQRIRLDRIISVQTLTA